MYKRMHFEWLDEVNTLPNIYSESDLKNKSDYFSVSPTFRINGEMIKRWHNNTISFNDINIPNFGYISIPDIEQFSLFKSDKSTGLLTHDFKLPPLLDEDNKIIRPSAKVSLSIYEMTLKVILERNSDLLVQEFPEKIDITIDCFVPQSLEKSSIYNDLTIENRIVPAEIKFTFSNKETKATKCTPIYVSNKHILMGITNKVNYSHRGIITVKDNILPWYPVNLSHIRLLTGVSTTTLSEIRHGKKDITRLLKSTGNILTKYSYIRFLDAYMHFLIYSMNSKLEIGKYLDNHLNIDLSKIFDNSETGQEVVITTKEVTSSDEGYRFSFNLDSKKDVTIYLTIKLVD